MPNIWNTVHKRTVITRRAVWLHSRKFILWWFNSTFTYFANNNIDIDNLNLNDAWCIETSIDFTFNLSWQKKRTWPENSWSSLLLFLGPYSLSSFCVKMTAVLFSFSVFSTFEVDLYRSLISLSVLPNQQTSTRDFPLGACTWLNRKIFKPLFSCAFSWSPA